MSDITSALAVTFGVSSILACLLLLRDSHRSRKLQQTKYTAVSTPRTPQPIVLPLQLREPESTWISKAKIANQLEPGETGYAVKSVLHTNKRGECFLFANAKIYGTEDMACTPKLYLVVRRKADGTIYVSCKEMTKKPWYRMPTTYLFADDIPITELEY
jgi:hypothetical protein